MYQILEEIGAEAGFVVNHKHRYGEINNLDFAYFPVVVEAESNWYPLWL
jgi:hypothetical protein